MLTTLAECGGTAFEFVVATEGRLLSELRDRDATRAFLRRCSPEPSVVGAARSSSLSRCCFAAVRIAAVVCHAPWSHAIFAGVARGCGVSVPSCGSTIARPGRRSSNARAARPVRIWSSATASGPRRRLRCCSRTCRIAVIHCPVTMPRGERRTTRGRSPCASLVRARIMWSSFRRAGWSRGRDISIWFAHSPAERASVGALDCRRCTASARARSCGGDWSPKFGGSVSSRA